jgi:hypothetical protein
MVKEIWQSEWYNSVLPLCVTTSVSCVKIILTVFVDKQLGIRLYNLYVHAKCHNQDTHLTGFLVVAQLHKKSLNIIHDYDRFTKVLTNIHFECHVCVLAVRRYIV